MSYDLTSLEMNASAMDNVSQDLTAADPHGSPVTPVRTYLHLLLAAFGMVTLTLTAIIANLLVIIIFFRHRRLRRCKNVYLVGLSLADLGVGLCMPVGLADEMLVSWAPPAVLCRVYLVVRDSLLFISLLTVVQVSADRWWSVHKPFNYRVRQSKSTATTILSATWVLTFLLHLPVTGLYDVIATLVTSSPVQAKGSLGPWLEGDGGRVNCVEGGGTSSQSVLCGWERQNVSSVVVRVSRQCEVPYRHDVVFVVMLTAVRYLAPFLFLLVLNLTLYSKISNRKRLQVRRSISGIDTVLFSLLKASASDSECNNEDNNNDLLRAHQRMERRLSRLSPAPLNRRHTMSQILFPGMGNCSPTAGTATNTTTTTTTTASASSTFIPSPRQSRPLRRRVSLQDCLQTSGYSSSLQVPRRKSHGLTQSLSDSLLPVSRRASRDDLAKDMLLKQDKKAACFLGLLQGVLFVCWTPFTVVTIVQAASASSSSSSSSSSFSSRSLSPSSPTSSTTFTSSLVPHWTQACCLWLLLANSAINPFLYGLFNEDFSKVVMSWFRIKASKRDRLKVALRRFSMHIAVEMEKNGYGQSSTFETVLE